MIEGVESERNTIQSGCEIGREDIELIETKINKIKSIQDEQWSAIGETLEKFKKQMLKTVAQKNKLVQNNTRQNHAKSYNIGDYEMAIGASVIIIILLFLRCIKCNK